MKPDLRNILQERFHGHEADVDPGVWKAIQAQIAVPAADPVQELFRDRFQGHEVAVDPSVWNAIGSQIGHGAAAGTAAGGLTGWFAAASAVVILSAGILLYNSTSEPGPIAAVENVPVSKGASIEEDRTSSIPPQNEVTREHVEETPITAGTSAGRNTSTTIEEVPATKHSGKAKATPVRISSPRGPKTAAIDQHSPIEPVTTAPATTAIPSSKVPEEGTAVVESVINQLAEQVHLESQAAPVTDPVGPPAVQAETVIATERVHTPATSAPLPDIFLPNTFTPNGDGINDTYRVDLDGFETMMIRIYSLADNRLVFSTDNNSEWNGANCEKGYYLIAIEATTPSGDIVTKGKAIWLNNDRY